VSVPNLNKLVPDVTVHCQTVHGVYHNRVFLKSRTENVLWLELKNNKIELSAVVLQKWNNVGLQKMDKNGINSESKIYTR